MLEPTVPELRLLLRVATERLHQLAQSAVESDEFGIVLNRVIELNAEMRIKARLDP